MTHDGSQFRAKDFKELGEVELRSLGKAREIIRRWVVFYSQKRLHAGLKHLTPNVLNALPLPDFERWLGRRGR